MQPRRTRKRHPLPDFRVLESGAGSRDQPMGAPIHSPAVKRFGIFEMDPESRELRKRGVSVKLQDLPFKILTILLEKPGEVVARDELRNQLWSPDVFVDFDHSLNTAVTRVREALGDSADNPRYIETIPRRGYRFIAPVTTAETVKENGSEPALPPPKAVPPEVWQPAGRNLTRLLVVAMIALLVGAAFTWIWLRPEPALGVSRIVRITNTGDIAAVDPNLEIFPTLLTDGARLYFLRTSHGRSSVAQVSAVGGETISTSTPLDLVDPWLVDISPDGSRLLIREPLNANAESPFWILPTVGGGLQRVPRIEGHDGTWYQGRRRIVYAHGDDLLTANPDGSEVRQLVTAPGRPFWPRWSPDARRLRFTLRDPRTSSLSLWEVDADGKHLHPLLPNWNAVATECCGNWTADGAYFVFQSSRSGTSDIWALRETKDFLGKRSNQPIRLTGGPLQFEGPIPSRDGKRVFVSGVENRSELFKYDRSSRRLVPYLALPAIAKDQPDWLAFSRDKSWVAFTGLSDHTLWRARADGTERLQLTSPPMQAYLPRWSRDGTRIAFAGKTPGQPWRIYLVASSGGGLQTLFPEDRNQNDPDWSPDGNQIVFGRVPDYMAEASMPKAIYVFDLRTSQLSKLPGSDGFYSPRWSPDGRYLVALPLDEGRLVLFDFKTQKWSNLVTCNGAWPIWSLDSQYIYGITQLEGSDVTNYRLRLSDRKLERVGSARDVQRSDVTDLVFAGITPDDSLLLLANESSADIYALDLKEP